MDKKRERGGNWSQEEKELFLEIMKESAGIIENKKTDTNTNKRKNLEWINVQRKFYELGGTKREVEQLKGAWRRLRMSAKKRISEHKRAVSATGGGRKPPSPTNEDKIIMDICPTDFVTEDNTFDSDGIFTTENVEVTKSVEKIVVEEIFDIEDLQFVEEKERKLAVTRNEKDLEFVEEMEPELVVKEIVVAEIHNEEVTINTKPKQMTPKYHSPTKTKEKCKRKPESSQKASILLSNTEVKERTIKLIEEEFALKIEYQKKELSHQDKRQKLELEILLIEKEKKEVELAKAKSA